jgi:hypothetical protein
MLCERSNSRFPFLGGPGTVRAELLALAAVTLLVLLGPIACGGGEGPAVADLRVEPRELTLPHATVSELQLRWELTAGLGEHSGEPRVFVHLLDEEGRLTRTFDHPWSGTWAEGEQREYSVRIYQSALAPPLPPGSYTLTMGVYAADGKRWPLNVEGERVGEAEYAVGGVTVPSGPADLPELGFTQGWSPTLAGGDRQVLALRWLTGNGAILVEEMHSERTLWLQLHIPAPGDVGARRIFRPGVAEPKTPSVRVVAPCSGFEAFVTGVGSHDVTVPVQPERPAGSAESDQPAETEKGRCTIRLEPNYAMVADGLEQGSVMLQNLSWVEDEGR